MLSEYRQSLVETQHGFRKRNTNYFVMCQFPPIPDYDQRHVYCFVGYFLCICLGKQKQHHMQVQERLFPRAMNRSCLTLINQLCRFSCQILALSENQTKGRQSISPRFTAISANELVPPSYTCLPNPKITNYFFITQFSSWKNSLQCEFRQSNSSSK